MDETQISDVVLAIERNYHELSLPELLVIWNLIVVCLSFTDLENGSITFEGDFNVLEFLGIDTFEFEHQFLLWDGLWLQDHFSFLENTWCVDVFSRHVLELKGSKIWVILEVLKHWVCVIGVCGSKRLSVGVAGALECSLVKFDLMFQGAVSSLVESLIYEVFYNLTDKIGLIINSNNIALFDHDFLESLLVLGPVILEFIYLTKLSHNLEEFISGTSLLRLEERQPEDLGFDASFKFAANICG